MPAVTSGRPRGVFLSCRVKGQVAIQADGHWRGTPGIEEHLLYIAVSDAGQETLTPEEFSRKYGWANEPDKLRLLEFGKAFDQTTTPPRRADG